uniref:Uncharacterized protein n=1 Tax=Prolemur simus TaxID=1328070 RepID=A0A8C8ZYK2_PROSS
HTKYSGDENLIALVSNLFVAGTETTASTLRRGILLMMRYPEVQKKVYDESTNVVACAQPRIARRTQMPYTDAVIQEVQRFANILPAGLPRATTTDIVLKNWEVRGENSRCLQSQKHRDELSKTSLACPFLSSFLSSPLLSRPPSFPFDKR